MGGGLGGTQTTQVSIPQWLEDAAQGAIGRAEMGAQLGYMPYMGPDVAAFSPSQNAAFAANMGAANAFGLPTANTTGLPEPTNFGGFDAYSSYPMYRDAVDTAAGAYPGQMDAYRSLFIDPVNGGQFSIPGQNPQGQVPGTQMEAQPSRERSTAWRNRGNTDPAGPVQGGYTGLGDMFDGGGPGASGPSYQGAGLLSQALNYVTGSPQAQPGSSTPTPKPTDDPRGARPKTVGTRVYSSTPKV